MVSKSLGGHRQFSMNPHAPRFIPQARRIVTYTACMLAVGCGPASPERPSVPTAPAVPHEPELQQATEGAIRMIRAFSQGDAGNCASIGVIKAALYEYGEDVVAERTETAERGLVATLRNGEKVAITADERAKAPRLSRFRPGEDNSILERANELFILMAKRLQIQRATATIEAAAEDLNSGEYFASTPALLGISDDVIRINGNLFTRWFKKTAFVRRNSSCVAASRGHAWFVSHGFADDHGTTKRFGSLFSSWYSFKATNVYCLVRKVQTQPPGEVEVVSEVPR